MRLFLAALAFASLAAPVFAADSLPTAPSPVTPVRAETAKHGNSFSFTDDAHRWTRLDYGLEGAAVGLLVTDWSETLGAVKNPHVHELNPILGPAPSRGAVNRYFAVATGSEVLASVLLPRRFRRWLSFGVIGAEATCVGNNLHTFAVSP